MRGALRLLCAGLAAAALLASAGIVAPAGGEARAGGGHVKPPPAPPPPDPAEAISSNPIPESAGWRSYVLDSPSPFVYPAGVRVLGDPAAITDPEGVMRPGGSVATIGPGATLVVDLGVNVGGTVDVSAVAGEGGPLRVAYSESLRYLQPSGDTRGVGSLGLNDDPNGRSDLIYAPSFFHSPGQRGAERFLSLSVDGPGAWSVDFTRVSVGHLRPAIDDYTGHFLSSNRLLNRIWFAGAYTLNTNAVRDPRQPQSKLKLVDGAKRDRLLWLGDLAMQSLSGHYTVRQMPAILERSLRSFGCQQEAGGYIPMASDLDVNCPGDPGPPDGPPPVTQRSFPSLVLRDRLPAYTPWFDVAICDSYQLTGNVKETRELLPVMRRTLKYFRSKLSEDGLFLTPDGAINWRAFDPAAGEDAHTNALWVRAMRRLALVEDQIGDPARAAEDRAMADELSRNLIDVLFDHKVHLFRTNTFDPLTNHAQDGTVEALLSGVLKGEGAERSMRALRARLWTRFGPLTGESRTDPFVSRYISPFMSGWELLARLAARDGPSSKRLLTSLWGRMVNTSPHSTLWEAMSPEGFPVSFKNGGIYRGRTSLAHGWSTAPVTALSGYVAGMRPGTPGWKTWLVEPQTLGLRFAQGRVGTPFGSLAARWALRSAGRTFRLTVEGPAATTGTVGVPLLGAPRAIARDGRVLWEHRRPATGVSASSDGSYVYFPVGPGTHTFAWHGTG